MRWPYKPKRDKRLDWHTWFAWHPVTIDGVTVWLEFVERKLKPLPSFDMPFEAHYREVQPRALAGNI